MQKVCKQKSGNKNGWSCRNTVLSCRGVFHTLLFWGTKKSAHFCGTLFCKNICYPYHRITYVLSSVLSYFLLLIGFCIICQATTLFFHGKEPMMFYVCLGKMPKEVIELSFKKNSTFTFAILVSVVCHIYILPQFALRHFKEKKSEQTEPKSLSIQHYLRDRIQKESLFRLVFCVQVLFILHQKYLVLII